VWLLTNTEEICCGNILTAVILILGVGEQACVKRELRVFRRMMRRAER